MLLKQFTSLSGSCWRSCSSRFFPVAVGDFVGSSMLIWSPPTSKKANVPAFLCCTKRTPAGFVGTPIQCGGTKVFSPGKRCSSPPPEKKTQQMSSAHVRSPKQPSTFSSAFVRFEAVAQLTSDSWTLYGRQSATKRRST